jgi:hypothetical protein
MPESHPSSLRASDEEREAAVARLRTGAVEGRLTLDELATRVERALAAVTRGDLEPLTGDLPVAAADSPAPAEGRRWMIGIMGGGAHRGRWRIARRSNVINVMGGVDLSLAGAIVDDMEIEIRVFSLMGGSTIVVPEGVHVELTGFAFMGGNDLKLKGATPPPGAPIVRVRAYSMMGGTTVRLPRHGRSRSAGTD